MLQNGALDEKAQIALVLDSRHRAQHEGLRRCDGAFRALVTAGDPQAQGGDGGAAPKAPEVLYSEYLQCTSAALCPSALHAWLGCVQQARGEQTSLEGCAVTKRLLERCLRGEAQSLLRASQPDVFPHTGV